MADLNSYRPERMRDPEERKPQKLRRAAGSTSRKTKVHNSSISYGEHRRRMAILTTLISLVVVAFLVYVIYQGIQLFIG